MHDELEHKKAHVRRSQQTRLHRCHWPGCETHVPPAKWGCYPHWMKLPKSLRDEIWNAYRVGQEESQTPSRAYVEAAKKAQLWISIHMSGL